MQNDVMDMFVVEMCGSVCILNCNGGAVSYRSGVVVPVGLFVSNVELLGIGWGDHVCMFSKCLLESIRECLFVRRGKEEEGSILFVLRVCCLAIG